MIRDKHLGSATLLLIKKTTCYNFKSSVDARIRSSCHVKIVDPDHFDIISHLKNDLVKSTNSFTVHQDFSCLVRRRKGSGSGRKKNSGSESGKKAPILGRI
jgi:hypothetical protein